MPPCGVADHRLGRRRGLREHARGIDGILDRRDAGVDRSLIRILLVHDPPRDPGREGGNRHRHEDRRLERDRPSDPLREDREDRARSRSRAPGTTRTQIALFLTAVSRTSLVKIVLVVVEPDEPVARPIEEAADDRSDRRVDDPDPEKEEGRSEEREGDRVAPPVASPLGRRRSGPGGRLRRDAGAAHSGHLP